MSTVTAPQNRALARRTAPLVGWGLVAGGVFYLAGGQLHPKQDPPGVSLKEHMRVMFEDSAWYPAHALLFIGTALLAASLIVLVRGRTLSTVSRVHRAAAVAAVTAAVCAAGTLLHLVAALDADEIAAGHRTPVVDVQVIVETITFPAFSLSIAYLAVIGAVTRTLGNRITAIPGVLGGLGLALASGTFLFTDRLDFLFPTAAGIAIWAIAAGTGLLLRRRAARHDLASIVQPPEVRP